jgi:hypothetical protein
MQQAAEAIKAFSGNYNIVPINAMKPLTIRVTCNFSTSSSREDQGLQWEAEAVTHRAKLLVRYYFLTIVIVRTPDAV